MTMEKNRIHICLYNAFIVLCLLGGAVYAVSRFMHFGNGEFTDNARVRQNIVPHGSRVQGFIREVRFTDFQQVKKGDTLVVIDDAEFRLRLAQAEADLIRAEQAAQRTASSIVTARTGMTVTEAGIESARVQMENAMREDNRFRNLLGQDAVTRQQYDEVHTAYQSARAAYEQAVFCRPFCPMPQRLSLKGIDFQGALLICGLMLTVSYIVVYGDHFIWFDTLRMRAAMSFPASSSHSLPNLPSVPNTRWKRYFTVKSSGWRS